MRYTIIVLGETIGHVELDAAMAGATVAAAAVEPLPQYALLRPRLERAAARTQRVLAAVGRRGSSRRVRAPREVRVLPPQMPRSSLDSVRGSTRGRAGATTPVRQRRRSRALRWLREQHALALALQDEAGQTVAALVTFEALGDRPKVRVLLGAWPEEPFELGDAVDV